ncbi:hypothetical protein Mapa_009410 [Marchantia paleacea]|nr:hypothetical protein Mapa_009410 [Marchantia paleacea]
MLLVQVGEMSLRAELVGAVPDIGVRIHCRNVSYDGRSCRKMVHSVAHIQRLGGRVRQSEHDGMIHALRLLHHCLEVRHLLDVALGDVLAVAHYSVDLRLDHGLHVGAVDQLAQSPFHRGGGAVRGGEHDLAQNPRDLPIREPVLAVQIAKNVEEAVQQVGFFLVFGVEALADDSHRLDAAFFRALGTLCELDVRHCGRHLAQDGQVVRESTGNP